MAELGPNRKQVVVTGGAGFIGSHLVEALVADNEVTVYDSLVSGDRSRVPEAATLVEADLRNEDRLSETVAEADLVFHEAALVSVDRSIEAPRLSHDVNTRPTLSLLEAARKHDVPVVLASSAAIYGHPQDLPIQESHPKQPTSPYGLDKLAVDHYARLYHERYGLRTVALRYFNVYGPRQGAGDYAGVIAVFRDQAQANEPVTIEGDGQQTRDFVHVDDVVQANLRAATSASAAGKAFNVGTGTSISIRALAESIVEVTGSASSLVHVEEREGDISESVADITRAREVLGYEPTYDLESGLRAYLGTTV